MADLSAFPITKRWPASNPDVIQLYSLPTPNGIKVSATLEETGLAYEPHLVDFGKSDQLTEEFLSLNPNNKIPAIIDPNGPDGKPLGLFESGAILFYLAEKAGKLLPEDAAGRYETLQWVMFQMGGVGPMFGQIGFFVKFAGKDIEDPRPRQRYIDEARRLIRVIEGRLQGRDYMMGGEYTIADIALWPWLRTIDGFYEAGELVGLKDFPRVLDYMQRCEARPASRKAVNIPSRG
ncbi:MAG: glutathione S-transferase N-terminal domain-containing protein [Rhizobiaceae bacterium]|nr:glutathione S-transferase N-terminal domain-containing protein [Rhizobiaceae bacterium]